jgi:hypothetical protein
MVLIDVCFAPENGHCRNLGRSSVLCQDLPLIMRGDEEPLVAAALFLLQLLEELLSVARVTVVVIFIRKHLARSTKAWS